MDTAILTLKKNRAFLCLECGKCTAVCPVSRHNDHYSPRRLVAEGLFYGQEELVKNSLLWSCLTCLLCSQRCPVDVKYSDYMQNLRTAAHNQGITGCPTHGGALHYIMEMAAAPGLTQNRTGWITEDLKVADRADVLYFVGCLPYYEELFGKELSFSPVGIARDTVRILNHLGIEPAVLSNERCCGHDLYWLGQMETFTELARLNREAILATGARTVVTACAECALTLKNLYTGLGGPLPFAVKHISELMAEKIDRFRFKRQELRLSFHDPCRLGRFMGVYEPPRQALGAIPGVELREMVHNRRGAICCGTTNWTNCDGTSKKMQFERLSEARAAGADLMVTACPKCQIHFRCSECGEGTPKINVKMTDLVNIIASALEG